MRRANRPNLRFSQSTVNSRLWNTYRPRFLVLSYNSHQHHMFTRVRPPPRPLPWGIREEGRTIIDIRKFCVLSTGFCKFPTTVNGEADSTRASLEKWTEWRPRRMFSVEAYAHDNYKQQYSSCYIAVYSIRLFIISPPLRRPTPSRQRNSQ
jgi:hypothetical protein